MVDELPTPEPRAVLESIYEQNRRFYSDRRGIGALRDLQQTFPNPWLYIAELLQNAVDEGATRITINIREHGSVVFEHDDDLPLGVLHDDRGKLRAVPCAVEA